MVEELFFELLRVAMGTQDGLSSAPTADEWRSLLGMAQKQALVGVCFAGVKRLERRTPLKTMPVPLRMQWVAMTAHIQRQNEVVNRRCGELCRKLSEEGFETCLLKGQAFAEIYEACSHPLHNNSKGEAHTPSENEHRETFGMLRQSGDIDMWVIANPRVVLAWARRTGRMRFFDYHHADVHLFPDVEVELHYRPSISRNLVRNARLQRWFREYGRDNLIYNKSLNCYVPDWSFNVILCINHIFCHLFFEGVGLRQLMDCYYVLKANPNLLGLSDSREKKNSATEVVTLLRHFKLLKFAAAVMWVEREVFGLQEEYMLCAPDERAGRFLLSEIMRAGNFGHHDVRIKGVRDGNRMQLMWRWMKHSMRLFKLYPADVLWLPIGVVRISMWRRFQALCLN